MKAYVGTCMERHQASSGKVLAQLGTPLDAKFADLRSQEVRTTPVLLAPIPSHLPLPRRPTAGTGSLMSCEMAALRRSSHCPSHCLLGPSASAPRSCCTSPNHATSRARLSRTPPMRWWSAAHVWVLFRRCALSFASSRYCGGDLSPSLLAPPRWLSVHPEPCERTMYSRRGTSP
jgi:hypothetical protein